MRIFKDVISGDEMFSDSFPYVEVGDAVYEVEGKFIVKKEGDYGISSNTDEDAAEGATGEGTDSTEQRVINIVDNHRLTETGFDKKSFMGFIRAYMKAIKAHLEANNPSRVEGFMSSAQAYVKDMMTKFDDFQFWMGASMNPEGGMAFMYYKEDGITPVFVYFKDGLVSEKF